MRGMGKFQRGFRRWGFHFQRQVMGFRRTKRVKLFGFSSVEEMWWFLAQGGFRRARKVFPARANREWWCSNGVAGWLCKRGEGLADRAFPARWQEGFQRDCREVPACKKSVHTRGGGVLARSRGGFERWWGFCQQGFSGVQAGRVPVGCRKSSVRGERQQ